MFLLVTNQKWSRRVVTEPGPNLTVIQFFMSKQNRDVWRWSSEFVSRSVVQFTVLVTVKTILFVWDCIFFYCIFTKSQTIWTQTWFRIFIGTRLDLSATCRYCWGQKKGVLINFWCIRLFMRSSTLLHCFTYPTHLFLGFWVWERIHHPHSKLSENQLSDIQVL